MRRAMSENRIEALHTLLNSDGRTLLNVKFFPGTARGLTKEEVARETQAAVGRVFASGLRDEPPLSGRALT